MFTQPSSGSFIITVNGYTRTHDFRGAALVVDHLGDPGMPFKALSEAAVNGATMLDLDLLAHLLTGS